MTLVGTHCPVYSRVAQAHYLSPVTYAYIITSAKYKSLYENATNPLELPQTRNKKPYGFIDGPFIPQDTQSKKSEYIESAWECGCYLWILLSRFLNVFLFACSRLLLTRDTLCTGFWTQITKNNILIVNTFFQSSMLKVMYVYSILITDK